MRKRHVQEEVLKNLRNIYKYVNQPLPPSFERYAKENCQEDFSNLAGNRRFQDFIEGLDSFNNRYLEFKRIYHRVLVDIHRNS